MRVPFHLKARDKSEYRRKRSPKVAKNDNPTIKSWSESSVIHEIGTVSRTISTTTAPNIRKGYTARL